MKLWPARLGILLIKPDDSLVAAHAHARRLRAFRPYLVAGMAEAPRHTRQPPRVLSADVGGGTQAARSADLPQPRARCFDHSVLWNADRATIERYIKVEGAHHMTIRPICR